MATTVPQEQHYAVSLPPPGQELPSITTLTNSLSPSSTSPQARPPKQPDIRDSGAWSMQSKHSSTVSNNANLQIHTILNTDESPGKLSGPTTPLSARLPLHHGSDGPNRNSTISDPRLSTISDSRSTNASDLRNSTVSDSRNSGADYRLSGADYPSTMESRRSSVDSRMNSGMSHLGIGGPSSPYDSQNHSQLSLVSDLRQQRGIATPAQHRTSAPVPVSPLSGRSGVVRNSLPRVAPVITPNPRGVSGMPDPTAAAPTKGYAWAFPDAPDHEEMRRSSEDSSPERSMPSRQNSHAPSVASSMYTGDTPLPPGQRRFDTDINSSDALAKLQNNILNGLVDPTTTHHHSMKNKTIAQLQSAEQINAQAAGGNYSRTPELRNSHKLAERKRRSEMKDLFDTLNEILPGGPSSKTSKWEVLSKAIEHIRALDRTAVHAQSELQRVRPEIEFARRAQEENELLRNEMVAMYQQLRRLEPHQPHVYGQMTSHLAQQQAQTPTSTTGASTASSSGLASLQKGPSNSSASSLLPPLQGQQNQTQPPQGQHSPWTQFHPSQVHQGGGGAGAMQGVEMYGMRR